MVSLFAVSAFLKLATPDWKNERVRQIDLTSDHPTYRIREKELTTSCTKQNFAVGTFLANSKTATLVKKI